MLITVTDLEREPLHYKTSFPPDGIDLGSDVDQKGPMQAEGVAELLEEHRGPKEIVQDIRIRGSYKGLFQVPCARCLDPVEHPLAGDYDVLFRPIGVDSDDREHSIGASETEIGYYQDGSLMLEDVLREQVLLSLPARTLCRDDCKGICPRCGANSNTDPCFCEQAPADPRWSALAGISSKIKTS
jgi:uncharacterized protein